MNNNFFGAYLKIEVNAQSVTKYGHVCNDGQFKGAYIKHSDEFCSRCGKPRWAETIQIDKFPTCIVDDILDDSFEDVLAECTPPSLHGSGVILARSNMRETDDTWLYLHNRGWPKNQVIEFPSPDRIEEMKNELGSIHQDVIELIANSPLVKSVEVKAGYVLDADF